MSNNEKKISAREKILLTAHDLFYSTGFKATGIDKIIKQAAVTKVTFYRHYPAKSSLILAYLNYRHELWINWFHHTLSLQLSAGETPSVALAKTLDEWFSDPLFRGCAFINATAEAESEDIVEEIKVICRQHKYETGKILASLCAITEQKVINQIMMLIDGAIIHTQMGMDKREVISQLMSGLGGFFVHQKHLPHIKN